MQRMQRFDWGCAYTTMAWPGRHPSFVNERRLVANNATSLSPNQLVHRNLAVVVTTDKVEGSVSLRVSFFRNCLQPPSHGDYHWPNAERPTQKDQGS